MPQLLQPIKDLQAEIDKLKEEREQLTSKINKDIDVLEAAIQYYIEKNRQSNKKINIYTIPAPKLKHTLKDEIKKIILVENEKFESSKSITNKILKYFPEKRTEEQIKNFRIQISGLLSVLKDESDICLYQFSTAKRDTVWGRKEWLTASGHPKEGYFIHPLDNLFEENKKEQPNFATL